MNSPTCMYFDELDSLFFSFSWDSALVIASLWRLMDDTKTEWGEPSTTISLGVFCSPSQGWKIAQSNNFYTFCVIRAAIPALIADLQLIKDLNWRCWWIIKAFRLKLRRFFMAFSRISNFDSPKGKWDFISADVDFHFSSQSAFVGFRNWGRSWMREFSNSFNVKEWWERLVIFFLNSIADVDDCNFMKLLERELASL